MAVLGKEVVALVMKRMEEAREGRFRTWDTDRKLKTRWHEVDTPVDTFGCRSMSLLAYATKRIPADLGPTERKTKTRRELQA